MALIRDKLQKGLALETAAEQTVDECIGSGILADFLSIHRAEVFDVILTEYDEQRHIAAEKEVSWEEGYEDGKLVAAVQLIRRKHDKKLSASQAATELELEEEFVANVMAVLKEHKEEDDAGIIKYLKKVE